MNKKFKFENKLESKLLNKIEKRKRSVQEKCRQTRHGSVIRRKKGERMAILAFLGLFLCVFVCVIFCVLLERGNINGSASVGLVGTISGIMSTIVGVFCACIKDIYSFEFGSSRGSKDKDRSVSTMIEKMENK